MRNVSSACSILLLATLSLAAGKVCAEDLEDFGHTVALGVNYPGANLKVFFTDSVAGELRGEYADKIFTGGARVYYYPSIFGSDNAPLRPFLGVEGDHISFKGRISKGSGAAFGALGGVEWFLSKNLSVQTDAGPFYIAIRDKDSVLKQGGLEFVLNFSVNLYFK